MVQTVQGRQTLGYTGNGTRSNAPGTGGNINGGTNTAGQTKKMLLVEALELGVALDEEQMAFLADNGDTVTTGQESQEIPTPAIFQTDDLDSFDSNCDEAPSASAVVMAKLSAYDSDVLSEYSEQPPFINDYDIDITNDSNVISYEQYLQETKNEVVQDTNSSVQQDAIIISVIENMSKQVAKCNEVNKENKTINESGTAELERYKEHIKFFEEIQKVDLTDREKYIDSQMRGVIESKAKEYKYLEEIIDLEKKKKVLDSVVYKMGQSTQTMHIKAPALYYGHTIVNKHDALYVVDTKETLILAEESLAKEITDMKEVFNQMKTEVAKCFVEMRYFEIEKKELFIENDHLLEHIICQDVVCIVMHVDLDTKCVMPANDDNLAYAEMEQSFIDEYSRCVKLEAKLSKKYDKVEKDVTMNFQK
ncbi:hypothetical protein Tco_1140636, partial [Tanacetum coccineum]